MKSLYFVVCIFVQVLVIIVNVQGKPYKYKQGPIMKHTIIKKEYMENKKPPYIMRQPQFTIIKIQHTKRKPRRQLSTLDELDAYIHAFAFYMTRMYIYIQDQVRTARKKTEWQCMHNKPPPAYPNLDIKTWTIIPDKNSPLRQPVSFQIRCKKQWALQNIIF